MIISIIENKEQLPGVSLVSSYLDLNGVGNKILPTDAMISAIRGGIDLKLVPALLICGDLSSPMIKYIIDIYHKQNGDGMVLYLPNDGRFLQQSGLDNVDLYLSWNDHIRPDGVSCVTTGSPQFDIFRPEYVQKFVPDKQTATGLFGWGLEVGEITSIFSNIEFAKYALSGGFPGISQDVVIEDYSRYTALLYKIGTLALDVEQSGGSLFLNLGGYESPSMWGALALHNNLKIGHSAYSHQVLGTSHRHMAEHLSTSHQMAWCLGIQSSGEFWDSPADHTVPIEQTDAQEEYLYHYGFVQGTPAHIKIGDLILEQLSNNWSSRLINFDFWSILRRSVLVHPREIINMKQEIGSWYD